MTDNNQKNEVSETGDAGTENAMPQKKSNPAGRILFLAITAMCFVYLYYRLNGAASREEPAVNNLHDRRIFERCVGALVRPNDRLLLVLFLGGYVSSDTRS